TESWEQKMAQALEEMEEVVHYVKNHGLNFTIPYTHDGDDGRYIPDFIVHIDTGLLPGIETGFLPGNPVSKEGSKEYLNLIVEVSGNPDPKKPSKVATAADLWVPAVNNDGRFGRWDFIQITDPWDAKNTIRAHINNRNRVSSAKPGF